MPSTVRPVLPFCRKMQNSVGVANFHLHFFPVPLVVPRPATVLLSGALQRCRAVHLQDCQDFGIGSGCHLILVSRCFDDSSSREREKGGKERLERSAVGCWSCCI